MTDAAKQFMRRLIRMTLRDLLVIGLPIAALIFIAFWAAYQFVRPAPPHHLIISTGAPDGSYQSFAARYRDIFARNNIALVLQTSAGAVANLDRLLNRDEAVDVAFIQGGIVGGKATPGLVSLGMIYPEPLWLFYRSKEPIAHLDQLKGKRIAIGPEGSGTRLLALELLEAHGISGEPTVLSSIGGIPAAQALANSEVDAVFIVGAAQSGAVWTALYTPGVELFSFSQAEAYARRFPFLSVLTLPRGAIDFQRNLPPRDISLIAPTAMLVAREKTHPALVDLLLQAASEVHGEAGLFQKAGQFPTPNGTQIPLSKEADRYYKSGPPFLQRYLPFWAATLIDRLIVMLVPIIAIVYPLMKIAPYLYSWRVRSRVFRYYGQLKLLELQAEQAPESKTPEAWLAELDRIEHAAHRIPTPAAFADQVYTLRAHVHMVRGALLRRFAMAEAKSP
ncbi:MAG: ABC transporter substrate-binding protein [Burkholderiales bacterium]|nr:ABC transporter substrate-binding protein [Burkholderiales bacterium]